MLFLLCGLLVLPFQAAAEGIAAVRSDARILADGRLAVNSRFRTELPPTLQDALRQGVALDFALTYRLEKPAFAAYRDRISQWIGEGNSVDYRLSFQPTTRRYRVSVLGTQGKGYAREYGSLETAVKSVGATVDWPVLHRHALSDSPPEKVKAQIRLRLHTAKLPKPFQINAITSENWQLDSGWENLTISR